MRKLELIQQHQSKRRSLRVPRLHRLVLLNVCLASDCGASALLFGFGVECQFVLYHFFDGQDWERNVRVGQYVEAVELEWVARLLVCWQELEPDHGVDLCDGKGDVVPVDGRQRILQVNFKALDLRLRSILLLGLLLGQRTLTRCLALRHREMPLPQRIVFILEVWGLGLLLLRLRLFVLLLLFLNLDLV